MFFNYVGNRSGNRLNVSNVSGFLNVTATDVAYIGHHPTASLSAVNLHLVPINPTVLQC